MTASTRSGKRCSNAWGGHPPETGGWDASAHRDNRDTIARDIREVNRMGEIAEGFIRAGREEGMEEGMEKGREEGRARLVSV